MIPDRPALSWLRTRDGRMEVYAGGRRTRWQLAPRHGGASVGNHYGLAPPIAAGDPSYPNPRAALAALDAYLSASLEKTP